MSIPRDVIDLILAKIDLVDLINKSVPLRKKSGSNYFARCPFHQEKSASFSVSQPKQFYYCFGCGAHGNAIDFLMQYDRLNFPEAIEMLARETGVEIPQSSSPEKKNTSLPALFELINRVAQHYYGHMRKSPRAINYLKQRGISGQIAQQFQLGFAPPQWSELLDVFGKSDSDKKQLLEAGLIIKKEDGNYYDRFRDRIMFPIQDSRGRIIGFGGRTIDKMEKRDKNEPKYLNSPETPLFQKGHELYGLSQAIKLTRSPSYLLIVEGYMDVIALFQYGITNVVATLGTATTPQHLHLLFRYSTDLIFCFDGDEAGSKAAWRALQTLFPQMHDSLQIRFLFLPDGEDPDSLIRKEGKTAFEKRLTDTLSLSSFFFHTLSRQNNLTTMEGRSRFAASALNYIKQLPECIFQGLLLEELSKRARVDINELKQQIKMPQEIKPSDISLRAEDEVKLKLLVPMRLAITLLVQRPSLARLLSQNLPKLMTPGSDLLAQMVEIIKQNPNINTGALLEYWRGEKEHPFLAKLSTAPHMIPESGFEGEFLGAIRQLTVFSLDEEINRLLIKAAQEELLEEEKMALSNAIARKKNLLAVPIYP